MLLNGELFGTDGLRSGVPVRVGLVLTRLLAPTLAGCLAPDAHGQPEGRNRRVCCGPGWPVPFGDTGTATTTWLFMATLCCHLAILPSCHLAINCHLLAILPSCHLATTYRPPVLQGGEHGERGADQGTGGHHR